MKNNFLRYLIRKIFLYEGAVRRIQIGPLRGKVFKVSKITGLSPWYSGAEREHQKIFKSFVKPGDAVVDIGANWGLHTLYLSHLVGCDGLVVSIEPFAPCFVELEWHIKANFCKNVKLYSVAISDADGKAFFIPGNSPTTGSLSESYSDFPIKSRSTPITTRSLDSICSELSIEKLKLVKIDVEGAEAKVLHGAQQAIGRFRPYFVIDLHSPEQDVLVATLLTNFGYRIKRLWGPPILSTNTGWPDRFGVWGSILAFPHE